MGSSSHWWLIIPAMQEVNGNTLGIFFDVLDNNGMLSVLIRIDLMGRI